MIVRVLILFALLIVIGCSGEVPYSVLRDVHDEVYEDVPIAQPMAECITLHHIDRNQDRIEIWVDTECATEVIKNREEDTE